ncbi:hypothetical protein Ngar_c21680 [Candidatus Nitrososphaera gargensis Ga9.2]|uniref:Uncharacterized protein n=1 Tax=Nitrososphaera gargensis (strain Ga9.2) TaxID=1237085 RepID=K0IJ17_NITGG|nr:hypothetical protein [Candidatus Nitrososphaera gargensis]AFU59098.1 hypothetical protein Ngar_c21680 [Candidatus Nitrososphaera gargensis Ga9.2]
MEQNNPRVFKQTTDRSLIVEKEIDLEEPELMLPVFICDNTDAILDPMDQMKFALNEVQLKYGGIVVLKDAP